MSTALQHVILDWLTYKQHQIHRSRMVALDGLCRTCSWAVKAGHSAAALI